MKIHMPVQTVLFSLLFALSFGLATACAAPVSAPVAARRPIKLTLLADRSDSICEAQRTVWRKTALVILQALRPGDLVEIRAITDITDGAAPLFREKYPVKPAGSGRKIDNEYQAAVEQFRQGLLAAVKKAFGPPSGDKILASDIFPSFRDIGSEMGMDSVAVFMSDMLHVDPRTKRGARLNLETLDLSAVKPEEMATRLAAEYRWTPQTLRATRVFAVLNDAALCRASTQNRVGDVRAFYEPLIRSLGGTLVDFNSVWKGGGL